MIVVSMLHTIGKDRWKRFSVSSPNMTAKSFHRQMLRPYVNSELMLLRHVQFSIVLHPVTKFLSLSFSSDLFPPSSLSGPVMWMSREREKKEKEGFVISVASRKFYFD